MLASIPLMVAMHEDDKDWRCLDLFLKIAQERSTKLHGWAWSRRSLLCGSTALRCYFHGARAESMQRIRGRHGILVCVSGMLRQEQGLDLHERALFYRCHCLFYRCHCDLWNPNSDHRENGPLFISANPLPSLSSDDVINFQIDLSIRRQRDGPAFPPLPPPPISPRRFPRAAMHCARQQQRPRCLL
jgi:hypothetical protein